MGISGGVADGEGIVVQITAAISGLLSGMKESAEAVETGTAEMGAAFESLGSILSVALAPMLALTAAMKGISEIREAIDKTTELGVQLEILHQKTGMSVEELSALKYVAELNEVSFERFGMALQRLARNMESAARSGTSQQAAAFRDLGIQVADAEGHLRPMDTVLLDIADKFHGMEDGTKKAALSMDLFGRTGADLIPVLNLGREGIQRLEEQAQRLGVVLTTDNVESILQYDDAVKQLKASWGGLVLALATSVMPVLEGTARFLTAIVDVLRALGNALRAIVNFLLLDWKQAWQSGSDAVERLKDAWTAMSTQAEAPEEHKGTEDVPTTTTAKDQVSALQKAEQELREWHEQHIRTQYDASEHDIIFWKKMLDSTEEGTKEYIEYYQKWADATQKVQNTIDQANEARARRLEKGAQDKGDLTGELKMAQDAADQAKATFGNISKQYEDALAKVDGVREKMKQGWMGTFEDIHKAFTNTITQLRQTGGNLRDFMRGLFQNIADAFLQSQIRMVEAHLAAWIAQKGITAQAVEQTVALHAWEALQVIGAKAAEAAAGAWAAMVSIPFVGPVIAPIAAAAALAGVLALASTIHSAAGGFDIPAGLNPITQLHQREMVLPRQYADVIRGLAGGGGGNNRGEVHLHVHAMDAGGVRQFMMKHKDAVAGAAHSAAANGLGFREQPGRRA